MLDSPARLIFFGRMIHQADRQALMRRRRLARQNACAHRRPDAAFHPREKGHPA
jgi:hypothetical protein